MQKNVASQKIQLFAFDTTTGAPKTGDAANITAYVSKDHGAVTVLTDTSATEMDATNAKGIYVFDVAQGETNADELTFSAKSSTSNISITPRFVSTTPPNWNLHSIDSNGRVDVIKVAGTTQTARDIGASVLLSSGTGTGQLDFTSGVVKANATQFAGQAISAAAGVTIPSSIASPTNITAGTITTATNLTNNNDKTGYALSSAGVTAVWAEVMTGTVTAVKAMRGFMAAMLGKSSGMETATAKFRNVADDKDVITATVDADGNRSAVTLDLT